MNIFTKNTCNDGPPYAVLTKDDPSVVCMVCSLPIRVSTSLLPEIGERFTYECDCGNLIEFEVKEK